MEEIRLRRGMRHCSRRPAVTKNAAPSAGGAFEGSARGALLLPHRRPPHVGQAFKRKDDYARHRTLASAVRVQVFFVDLQHICRSLLAEVRPAQLLHVH